jgi:hypothetical protein
MYRFNATQIKYPYQASGSVSLRAHDVSQAPCPSFTCHLHEPWQARSSEPRAAGESGGSFLAGQGLGGGRTAPCGWYVVVLRQEGEEGNAQCDREQSALGR